MLNLNQVNFFNKNGYLQYDNILNEAEIINFRAIYEQFLSGKIDAGSNKHDLGGNNDNKVKITQIMRPSLLLKSLLKEDIYAKVLKISQQLLGDDMDIDFDMLIDKPPFSNMETPWHQDEAYWLNMPDKRAVSVWIALDDVQKENGCMWFEPESHLSDIKKHVRIADDKSALVCEGNEEISTAIEMMAGSCTFHHGRTLHYSRGNSNANRRRAFIINLRPKKMIEFERNNGADHLFKK